VKLRASAAQQFQPGRKNKKLFKYKSAPCFSQFFHGRRIVHCFIGIRRTAQFILLPDVLRQDFRQFHQASVQRLAYGTKNNRIAEPRGKTVYRQNPVGCRSRRCFRFKNGVLHFKTAVIAAECSVEAVRLSIDEAAVQVGLIEKCQMEFARFVRNNCLCYVQSLANMGCMRMRHHHCVKAGRCVRLQFGNGAFFCTVFISAGEIGNQVIERTDAQLFQLCRPCRTNSAQFLNGRKKIHMTHPS